MNFEEAKAFHKTLSEKIDVAELALKEFNQYKGEMGLIPDHIRETPEYQTAKKEFDRAFAAGKTYNKWYIKQFKKEIQKEVTENRKNRYKRAK